MNAPVMLSSRAMRLSDFNFELPERLIAQYPLQPRSASRLLVLDGQSAQMSHDAFGNLANHLREGDLLVLNDTRVIPARLFGCKATGGRIEVMLERVLDARRVLARVRASKSPKPGSSVVLADVAVAEVERRKGEFFVLKFAPDVDIQQLFEQHGSIPLPPYIRREAAAADREKYQTIYARHDGAVAAPTAGLHFDDSVFAALQNKGVGTCHVTLHVGAGTFQPVRVDNAEEHEMHAERVEVSSEAVQRITKAKAQGGRIIAVGTTSVRSLESAAIDGELKPYNGETRLFLRPGIGFRVVDGMVTNFHLPQSTLMMLVSAFAGHAQIMQAYQAAVKESYRFFSYGDAMLLWPDKSSWNTMSARI